MRILTVRQPWAWAIIHGGKNVENRTRNIAGGYRGPVLIHAALRKDVSDEGWSEWINAPLPQGWAENAAYGLDTRGAIIGVVDLVDVHSAGTCYAESIERAAALYRSDRDAFDALPVTNGSGGVLSRADYCSTELVHRGAAA